MSHFTVLVIGENLEQQLAPYHEYECTGRKDQYVQFVECEESKPELEGEYARCKDECDYETYEQFMVDFHGYEYNETTQRWGRWTNPNAKWDWYVLGGRWTGYFKMRPGVEGVSGEPGLMTASAKRGYADQAFKRDVDFGGMQTEAFAKAVKEYDAVLAVCEGEIPRISTWADIRDETDDIDNARDMYHEQEGLKWFNARKPEGQWWDLGDYQCTRQEYGEKAARSAIPTFAVVKDGKWFARGEMGWWACVSDEKESDVWEAEFNKLLADLPDDTMLSVYDCHI